MARRKKQDEPAVENTAERQLAPDSTVADGQQQEQQQQQQAQEPSNRNMSAIVREALARGIEKPKDIMDYARREHGIELTAGTVNQAKTKWKKQQAGGSEGTADTRTRRMANAEPAVTGIAAQLEGLKLLVQQLGKDETRRL